MDARAHSAALLSNALIVRVSWMLVLATALYSALLLYGDASQITASASLLTCEVMLVTLTLALLSYVLRFLRWAYYMRMLGLRVPLGDSALVFVSGFAMSLTPAKAGEVLKSMMLRESHDIALARSAPIVVAERATDVSALLLLGGFGMLGTPLGLYVAASCVAFTFALGLAMSRRALGEALIGIATRPQCTRRFAPKLLEAYGSLRALMSPTRYIAGTALSSLSWGLHGVILFVIAQTFPAVSLEPGLAMAAYAAPLLAGTVAMIPGGLGLTEASMTGAIGHFGGTGATAPVATTISLAVRVVTFWLAIALGFFALALWSARRRAATAHIRMSNDE